jgi:cytochrome oxidase Cu insertion factor (SCO1/SenC/PrrC family)
VGGLKYNSAWIGTNTTTTTYKEYGQSFQGYGSAAYREPPREVRRYTDHTGNVYSIDQYGNYKYVGYAPTLPVPVGAAAGLWTTEAAPQALSPMAWLQEENEAICKLARKVA